MCRHLIRASYWYPKQGSCRVHDGPREEADDNGWDGRQSVASAWWFGPNGSKNTKRRVLSVLNFLSRLSLPFCFSSSSYSFSLSFCSHLYYCSCCYRYIISIIINSILSIHLSLSLSGTCRKEFTSPPLRGFLFVGSKGCIPPATFNSQSKTGYPVRHLVAPF